jgi:hypothetical protein
MDAQSCRQPFGHPVENMDADLGFCFLIVEVSDYCHSFAETLKSYIGFSIGGLKRDR